MSRPKLKSRGLPSRVYRKHGAYYFVTADSVWVRLGSTEAEMYRELAKLSVADESIPAGQIKMTHVIREWRADTNEGLPSKGEKTQRDWSRMTSRIEEFFGEAKPKEIKPHHIKSFMNFKGWKFATQKKDEKGHLVVVTRALGRVSANRHVEVLSTILNYAIQRGYLDENPCREVKRNRERARTHLPTDQDFVGARERANPNLRVLMDAAYVSGMRKGDLINLRRSNLTDRGIQYTPGKTEKHDARSRLIPWTDDVRAIVDEALALQKDKAMVGPYVFTPPLADHWTNAGLNSAWRRLKPGFHFHDIRAMAATRHESIEDAMRLLAHSSESTTAIYRRGIVEVKPVPRLSDIVGEYRACA